MKVITYNILNPYHAVKWRTAEGLNEAGGCNWTAWRAEAIFNNLSGADFDVACLQEISLTTLEQLKARLSVASHDLHDTDEPEGAHGVATLYNPERVEVLRAGSYRSQATPERAAAFVDVRDLAQGRVVRLISVHIKGYNPYEEDLTRKRASQEVGDLELMSYITQALADVEGLDGVAFLGDFNEDEVEMSREGSRQRVLIERGFVWDQVIDTTETRTGRKIDWALYRPLTPQGEANVLHARPEQELSASDHALTGFKLSFK